MPGPITSMDVPVLFVEDVGRSVAFYRDAVGLNVQFEGEHDAGLDLGGMLLMVVDVRNGAAQVACPVAIPRVAGASVQLCSFVEDVDAAFAALTERGVPFMEGPKDQAWGRRTAFFLDPDGHVWEISQAIGDAQG